LLMLWWRLPREGLPGPCGCDAVRPGHGAASPLSLCRVRWDRGWRWLVLCLYFMGLNLSNRQIASELGLEPSDVQAMTEQLRRGLVAKAPTVELEGEVEPDARACSGIDEVYLVAGHKGQPAAVARRGGLDGAASWQERRAAARWKRTNHPSSA